MHAIEIEKRGIITPHDDVRSAVEAWNETRHKFGLTPNRGDSLITPPESQPKVGKNDRPTGSLTLTAGGDGLCVNFGRCVDICVVDKSWRADTLTVDLARKARAQFLIDYPEEFLTLLIDRLWSLHHRRDLLDLRVNANSDLAWERIAPALFDTLAEWGGVAYDYTKRMDRVGWLLPNYRTTYSATSATRESTIRRILDRGDTVTAVFWGGIPTEWRGMPVIDGDRTDDRFRDPAGVIVGLKAKGRLLKAGPNHPLITK